MALLTGPSIQKPINDLDNFLGIPFPIQNGTFTEQAVKLSQISQLPNKQNAEEDEKSQFQPKVLDDMSLVYPIAGLLISVMTPQSFTPNDPYYLIQDYVNFSQPSNLGVKILKVYQLSELFEDLSEKLENLSLDQDCTLDSDQQNRMMLWHGTKSKFVWSILENGLLRSRTSGNGVYFADRIAKSSYYCGLRGTIEEGEIGYLFLCEVELGKIVGSLNHRSRLYANCKDMDIVKYLGGLVPEGKGDREVDGVIWPLGITVDKVEKEGKGDSRGRKDYNEFVVYDEKKIKLRYLVKVEFKKEPVFNFYNLMNE